MSLERPRQDNLDVPSSEVSSPSPTTLAALTAIGMLAALWALFLWAELVLERSGGAAFCPFGGRAACAAIWSSGFARAVHRVTGVPVAGWGLVWSLEAFALPLLALQRAARRRPLGSLVSAVRLTAAAGVVVVLLLVAVSAAERAFCAGCLVSYLLAAAYAGFAFSKWKRAGFSQPGRGLALALGSAATAFLLLLYPGLKTPRASGEAGRRALAEVGGATPALPPLSVRTSESPVRNRQLAELLASLDPELRQTLSDSLYIYRNSPAFSGPAPRALLGSDLAPVRITAFTDVLCDHCAELHETLRLLRERLPPGSFSVDSRQFPLNAECNPLLRGKASDPVRCLAAKAQICLEGEKNAFAFSGSLFGTQKSLSPEKVFELAAPYMARATLEGCVAGQSTRQKLEADIAFASQFQPDGTPIVLVNGRRGTSFGPFLYAMILTRGEASDPIFEALPPPNPEAHLH